MRKRVHVSPLNNETLSQCQYRTAELAFEDFKDFNIYYFNGYGGWIFEFYYDLPEDLEMIEGLTYHFDIYYQFAGYEKESVLTKFYFIETTHDDEKDFENM